MSEPSKNLGRLVSVHPIAPVYLQRAVFIVLLSFLFFLSMMFAYYIRQSALYFLLASGFLVVYLITMFSFVMQRKNIVKIMENGIEYRKFSAAWEDIKLISRVADKRTTGLEIVTKSVKKALIPASIERIDEIERIVREHLSSEA